jgi:DeoR/GlpR family transcriptional regulator of sugar metabolism
MLTSQRKHLILERLRQDKQVVAKTLGAELGLSEDTIRRDLRELAAEGLLQRVHGGALPASPALANFAAREHLNIAGKIRLGQYAAQTIKRGQVVFVDGGTTNTQLVRHLSPDLEATIVTHSPSIALELVGHSKIEVVLIGGKLFKHSIVSVGAAAIEAIGQIRADTFFMGVTAVAELGWSTGDLEEAHIKRAFLQSAAETVVLASTEKLGAVSPYQIAKLAAVSELVVETQLEPRLGKALSKAGVRVTALSRA